MLQLEDKPDTSLEAYKGKWRNIYLEENGGWQTGTKLYNGEGIARQGAERALADMRAWKKANPGGLIRSTYLERVVTSFNGPSIHMQIPVGDA